MYSLTPKFKNVLKIEGIYINKAGHILNLTKWIRYSTSSIFKNLWINWEKYVFHLDKCNFELIGYSAHIIDFLTLGKVVLTSGDD